MPKSSLYSFILLVFSFLAFQGIELAAQESIRIQGTVVDSISADPIPYATVAAFKISDQSLLGGTTSSFDGNFELIVDEASIYIEVSFIGFEPKTIRNVTAQDGAIDLGMIALTENALKLEAAEVATDRSIVEFKLDKRVYNVGQDISTAGMGALDVLGNVPSVNVDIDGQISLRGNQGVQILINGKPSVLSDDNSNALGTITGDMIESVEVITNPSAKHEAEGTSGIINIILKKEEKKGLNGSVSMNTGIPDNHSIGASLNLRTEKFNFFTQFGGGYRSMPTFNESTNRDLIGGTTLFSDGTEYRNEGFYNITLGADYHLNDRNVLTLSGNYALELEEQPSETEFRFIDEDGVLISSYLREENTTAVNPKYQYDLQYSREFKNNKEHVLLFSTQGSFFGKDQESDFINTALLNTTADPNQQTETSFYQQDFVYKLDYTNPFSKRLTLEAGGMYEVNDVGNEFAVYNLNGEVFELDSSFTNNFEFRQTVYGVYSTLAYQATKWGVKLGLRLEHTDLSTLLVTTGESNEQNYTNPFPTIHSSYKISDTFSVQAGYSRRIYRPRLWDLNPFFNIRNNYNIRRGNPELMPEYADSYELTGIFLFEKFSFNAGLYHLRTTEVIERVTLFEDNVSITQPINAGIRNQTGVEINGKYSPLKWLNLNGDLNYGFFSRTGEFQDQDFSFSSEQLNVRMTSRIKLPKELELELSADYQSGFETVQGTVSGFVFADAGIRKKFWGGKAVANFSVRDLFASRIRESIVNRNDTYFYNFSQRGRFLTLGFSYSFGKGEAMSYSGRSR